MGSINPTRPVRIMNISGSPCDKRDAIAKAAAMDEHVDVLVGDWKSELNMPTKAYNLSQDVGIGYEETFVEALEPTLVDIARKGIKVAANAGTVATKDLYEVVVKTVKDKGLYLTVSWIDGDAVMNLVRGDLEKALEKLVHISTSKTLKERNFEPVFAQCYLGGMGIVTAFKAGADIVICLETLDWEEINNIRYPIAEIAYENTGGLVSKETCKEQLLYEIQSMYYLNCDVIAVTDQACFTDIAPNRVRLLGVTGKPPPATTRMGLTAFGGYQAKLHWAMIGLDIEERVNLLEKQVRHSFGKARMAKFSLFDISVYGSVPEEVVVHECIMKKPQSQKKMHNEDDAQSRDEKACQNQGRNATTRLERKRSRRKTRHSPI
ncbi:uncharacterized protein PAC_18505 [Phialocephala subalpina]|uniref:Acyclic terpene utilisation N-terminal domain-containing protein n=1 Tax=Phialocephala subalpina TaxID=576137 RepID=A0A1L7XUB3_9HELO|nr:uncharacterized protein PAC_18505 [Phialocephala subalpina]